MERSPVPAGTCVVVLARSIEKVTIMWLKNRFLQKLGGGWMESFGLRTWSKLQFASLSARKDPAAIQLMRGIQREKRSLMSAFEQYIVSKLHAWPGIRHLRCSSAYN